MMKTLEKDKLEIEIKPDSFVDMNLFYPNPIEGENFSIDFVRLTPRQVIMASYRSEVWWQYHGLKADFNYVRLVMNNNVMMSDTPMERITNKKFIQSANGRVLMFGLGIGLCLPPLLANPDVESVLIVEKNPELIKVVFENLLSRLSDYVDVDKLTIVEGDAFDYEIPKDEKFDTIYFDIWDDISSDNYPQTKELHKRYRKNFNYDNPKRFMDSWVRDYIKRQYHRWS